MKVSGGSNAYFQTLCPFCTYKAAMPGLRRWSKWASISHEFHRTRREKKRTNAKEHHHQKCSSLRCFYRVYTIIHDHQETAEFFEVTWLAVLCTPYSCEQFTFQLHFTLKAKQRLINGVVMLWEQRKFLKTQCLRGLWAWVKMHANSNFAWKRGAATARATLRIFPCCKKLGSFSVTSVVN